jgi:hypothetical protein
MTIAMGDIPSRNAIKSLIVTHLHEQGILDQRRGAGPRVSSRERLDLGVEGVVHSPELGLLVDDRVCVGKERRLTHILRAGGPGSTGPPAYFPDIRVLEEACRDGYDPVLYEAYRDIFPPRHKRSGELVKPLVASGGRCASEDFWYADLVVYQAGTLRDGEPFRSTGHWNAPAQLEIFETLTGRVLMIMGGQDLGGRPYACYQICRAGDMAVVPFGAWHLTYCLDGPAAVFNVYTDTATIPGTHTSRAAANAEDLKYRTDRPLELASVRSGAGVGFVGSAYGLADHSSPERITTPNWIRPHLTPGALAELYLFGASDDLGGLEQAAHEAHASGYPSNTTGTNGRTSTWASVR